MDRSFQAQLLDQLEQGWGAYITCFNEFSASEQAAFLQKQGYSCLADLLGHVIAWWERALAQIPQLVADPKLPLPEVDVDSFNAAAVARYQDWEEQAVIARFHELRMALITLVRSLPVDALTNERIHWRLDIEIIGHLEEHEIA